MLRCGSRLFLRARVSSLSREEASVLEAVISVGDGFNCVLFLSLPGLPEVFVEFNTEGLIEFGLLVVGRPMLDSYRCETLESA